MRRNSMGRLYAVEHRLSQFYWTGLPRGPIPNAEVFPQRDVVEHIRGFLDANGIPPDKPYAVMQPGGRLETMRWPVRKFAMIARWLQDAQGIATVVNLPAQDQEVRAAVQNEMRGCAALLDSLDLRGLIAIIAGARLFVGNDSGPAHLAAATGRPSVVIYGTTNPAQWRPWGTEHRVAETGAKFRSERGDKTIAVHLPRSIAGIEVDEVRAACEALLSNHPEGMASGDVKQAR